MLSTPLTITLVKELDESTKAQAELRRAAGYPAQTTVRAQLKRLAEVGVIEKIRRNKFPGALEYELTPAGRDLHSVVEVLEGWLARAPDGPIAIGDATAKTAIKSLAESWSTPILRALAAGPMCLTELDSVISSLNYPALERRLGAMRLTGQVQACPSDSRGTPYSMTPWLRHGMAAITAAALWERRHVHRGTTPIGPRDIETILMTTAPLLSLDHDRSGVCRVTVELASRPERRVAGAMLSIEDGRIASCATTLQHEADAWALGPPKALLKTIVADDSDDLELGGDTGLIRSLLSAMHSALFLERIAPSFGTPLTSAPLIRDDGSN